MWRVEALRLYRLAEMVKSENKYATLKLERLALLKVEQRRRPIEADAAVRPNSGNNYIFIPFIEPKKR